MIVNPMEDLDREERTLILRDIMKVEPIQGDITIQSYQIKPVKTWTGKKSTARINGWNTEKHKIKLAAKVDYKKKARNYLA